MLLLVIYPRTMRLLPLIDSPDNYRINVIAPTTLPTATNPTEVRLKANTNFFNRFHFYL